MTVGLRHLRSFVLVARDCIIQCCSLSLIVINYMLLSKYEDNDRCHYYYGEWNKGDLTRGCIAVAVGMAVRYFLSINFLN